MTIEMKALYLIAASLLFSIPLTAQDDLMSMLEEETAQEKTYTFATFKAPRLINGHTVEQPAKENLLFIISHRFGQVNGGFYDMFGLDQASIRVGLDYGISDRISVGVGRSTYQKNYDGFLKVKLLRQATGNGSSPVTMSYLGTANINSLRWANPDRENYFSSRMSYTNQLLIARKFSKRISWQIMPTHVHKNLVPEANDENDIFAIGTGGRVKLTDWVSLVGEAYFLVGSNDAIPRINNQQAQHSLSAGVEVETGGHVFQFQFTNSQSMFETGFISETIGNWGQGGIHFGFNITRTFDLSSGISKDK